MKVGILTHYNVNNLGAQLQMYALQEELKKLGCDVSILTYDKNFDYVSLDIKKRNIISLNSIPYIFKEFLIKKGLKQTYFNYKKYEINKKFRKKFFSFKESSNANVDCTFVGSDEVFSIEVGCNKEMYGYDVKTKKIVSYAPSFGQTNISDLDFHSVREMISKGLSKFDYLSARDTHTLRMIKKLTNNSHVEFVCDPVLLHDFSNELDKIKIRKIKKPYIIVYGYDKNFSIKSEINVIKKYAKLHNLITVSIGTYHKWCDYNINCNCLEWIKYFKNSECVITDTFHGTILSTITNKPLVVVVRNSINKNKLQDLCKLLNIENRVLNNFDFVEIENIFSKKMNYDAINEKIIDLRNSSLNYIKKCIDYKEDYSDSNNILSLSGHCTGCGACVNVCPKNAIKYDLNEDGFYSTNIDFKKCINCGLCKKVCLKSRNNNELKYIKKGKLIAAYSNDKNILLNCTSGGIAYEIGKWGLQNGYYLTGTIYDNKDCIAKTIIVKDLNDLKKTRGSKYLQSKSDDYIRELLQIIKTNNKTKFIIFGTPCQIYGIKRVIKLLKISNEIIYIDLYCHGVPSYLIFQKYINNFNKKISNVEFRSKKNGWHNFTMLIDSNKKIFIKSEQSNFYDAFFDNILLNQSCSDCIVRREYTSSDLRLGDFWGKEFKKNNEGVSAISIFTKNGEKLIESIKGNITIVDNVNETNFFQSQSLYMYDNKLYDYAIKELKYNSLSNTIKKYRKTFSLRIRVKIKLKYIISFFPNRIKNIIRLLK